MQKSITPLLAGLLGLLVSSCATVKPEGDNITQQRAFVDKDTAELLATLYEREPGARKEVEDAVGYAVFRYRATKLPIVLSGIGGGAGYGLATEGTSNEKTYMKVSKVQWGVGLGVRELAVVFVFQDQEVFEKFRSGKWDTGGGAEATAKTGDTGAALAASASTGKGFKSYTFTESGLSYGATWHARRFKPNGAMN